MNDGEPIADKIERLPKNSSPTSTSPARLRADCPHANWGASMSELGRAAPLGDLARWFTGRNADASIDEYWSGDIPWTSAASRKLYMSRHLTMRHSLGRGEWNPPRSAAAVPSLVARGMSLWRVPIGITERELPSAIRCKATRLRRELIDLIPAYAIRARPPDIARPWLTRRHGRDRFQTDRICRRLQVPHSTELHVQKAASCSCSSALDDKIAVNDRIARDSTGLADEHLPMEVEV